MQPYEHIELTVGDGIGLLRFNRPDQLNAMNRCMMDEIIDALGVITGDAEVRVGILTGNGRAFMAGADIKEYAVQTPQEFDAFREKGMRLYQLIEEAGIPFIAVVNGFALGGGFEIALACDFIVAAETAKMGLPEVHLGLIPGGGGSYRLFQKLGLNRVKEVLLLGQPYSAEEMSRWGLVHKVTAEREVMEYARQLADKLKRRPAAALKSLKGMLVPGVTEEPFAAQMAREGRAVSELFYQEEAQKLIRAFIEKNK